MMPSVVQFSLQQRVFYNLMFVLMIVSGAYATLSVPVDRYPNVNMGEVAILTTYPGASPADVEVLVTRELEDTLEDVEDIEWIRGTSYRARSSIRLKFKDEADYTALFNEVRLNVLNKLGELPVEIEPPTINQITIDDYLPVITVNLAGPHSNRKLSLIADELRLLLKRIPNVKEIKRVGEYEPEFHVYLDPHKLKSLGVSFDVVDQALKRANVSVPAGHFKSDSGEYVIKVDERFRSPEQVQACIIRRDADGSFIRVGDVMSQARVDYQTPAVMTSVNGMGSLALQVIKTRSGNAMRIKAEVDDVVDGFKARAARENVTLVLTQDITLSIDDKMTTLWLNMLVGMLLVSLITWYFMGLRNAGLVTIGIPFSFMTAMLLMYLTGNSLNELTLFSFVLVTGVIVDDAIVVSENIYRHVQTGKPLDQAIVDGTSEVALPVVSASLTTVAAFMPMLIMTGSTGEFFALIPKAVSFAVLASLVECLLILPIHYLDFGPQLSQAAQVVNDSDDVRAVPLLQGLHTLVERGLRWVLRWRGRCVWWTVLALVAALVIMGVSISGKWALIRIQFFPDDYTQYFVDVHGPADASIEHMDQQVKRVSAFLKDDGPGMILSASGFAGYVMSDEYEPVYASNLGTVLVSLPPHDQQSFADPVAHLNTIRQRLKQKFEHDGQSIHVHAMKDGPPSGKDINIRVLGTDTRMIQILAEELLSYLQASAESGLYIMALESDANQFKRVIRFRVLQERVAEYSLDSREVARLAASVLDGRYSGQYRLSDEEVDLKLLIEPDWIRQPEDVLSIPLLEHASGPVLLRDLVQMQVYSEPVELHRYQGQRAVSLKADLKPDAPTSVTAVVHAVQVYYESIRDRYPGATVLFSGEHEDTQRSFDSLMYAFVIAVLVMYIILATQFQSYLQPLIILSAVIFAWVGVVFGALFTQTLFTVNSFIATIGVAGVVVNDALVLVDFMNKRYRSGASRREAIEAGVRIRLRPIVLTTLTTSLGLLPMALGFPSYSLVWGAMATTFVTGLAAATLLTLFVVPVLWDLLQGWHERKQRFQVS